MVTIEEINRNIEKMDVNVMSIYLIDNIFELVKERDQAIKERNAFAKEILDSLDKVVRLSPELSIFIHPIKVIIRELRDKKENKKD